MSDTNDWCSTIEGVTKYAEGRADEYINRPGWISEYEIDGFIDVISTNPKEFVKPFLDLCRKYPDHESIMYYMGHAILAFEPHDEIIQYLIKYEHMDRVDNFDDSIHDYILSNPDKFRFYRASYTVEELHKELLQSLGFLIKKPLSDREEDKSLIGWSRHNIGLYPEEHIKPFLEEFNNYKHDRGRFVIAQSILEFEIREPVLEYLLNHDRIKSLEDLPELAVKHMKTNPNKYIKYGYPL